MEGLVNFFNGSIHVCKKLGVELDVVAFVIAEWHADDILLLLNGYPYNKYIILLVIGNR